MTAPATVKLPPKLDLSTAAKLASDVLGARGGPLTLDAVSVTHLGTPGLQVLLSARKTWAEDAQALSVENVSDGVVAQLGQLGLEQADLETSGPETSGLETPVLETSGPETSDLETSGPELPPLTDGAPSADPEADKE